MKTAQDDRSQELDPGDEQQLLSRLDMVLNQVIQKYSMRIRSSIGVVLSYVKSHIWFLMIDGQGNVVNESLFARFSQIVTERGHGSLLEADLRKGELSGPILNDYMDALEEFADSYTPEDLLGAVKSSSTPLAVRAIFGAGQGVASHFIKKNRDVVYALAIRGDEGIETIAKHVSPDAYAMVHGRPRLLHLITLTIFSVLQIPYLSEEEKQAFEYEYLQELQKRQEAQARTG